MAVELYINDKQVDLIGKENIQIDYAIFDINEIDKRKGVRSYSFKLPKTANNRAIFENPEDVNSLSNVPYSKLTARLIVDGIDIGIKFCSLTSSGNQYSCNLYGGNSDFYSIIGNTKLNELLFCDLNHRWDKTLIANSRTNTSGYIYPLIDYNSDSPNSVIDNTQRRMFVDTMFPSVFYDHLLGLCIDYFGYTFTNEVPQSNLLLAYSGAPFIRTSNSEYLKVKAETTSDQPALYSTLLHQMYFTMHQLTQSCDFWEIGTSVDEVQFNFEDGATIEGRLYWILENTSGSPVTVDLWMGSNIVGTPEFQQSIYLNTGVNIVDYTFTLTNQSPDQYTTTFYFTIYDPADTAITVKSGSYVDITSVSITEQRQIEYQPFASYGDYITPTSIYGDIKVIDLIKYYCQMFGLVILVDEINKQVRFIKFDSIKGNNNIYDWSDKLDFSQEHLIEFSQSKYGQNNHFEYSQDGDEVKPIGTDGVLTINDENLEANVTIVELPYAASVSELMLKDIPINKIPVLVGEEIQKQCAIRPLRLYLADTADFTDTSQFTYKDGGADIHITTDLPLTYFIDFTKSDSIGFAERLLQDYYMVLSDVLNRLKVVSVPIRLNASDINQLDFTRPVYIKHFNAYFYISAIKAYTPTNNESTTVELVKLF